MPPTRLASDGLRIARGGQPRRLLLMLLFMLLFMAMRYLVGGSALDIMYLHGLGSSTFYACLLPTLRAIEPEGARIIAQGPAGSRRGDRNRTRRVK